MHTLSTTLSVDGNGFSGLLAELANNGAWSESLKLLTLSNGAASIAAPSIRPRPISDAPSSRLNTPTLVYAPEVLITDASELAERLAVWERVVVDDADAGILAPLKSWLQRRRQSRRALAEQRVLERAIRANGNSWLIEAEDVSDQC